MKNKAKWKYKHITQALPVQQFRNTKLNAMKGLSPKLVEWERCEALPSGDKSPARKSDPFTTDTETTQKHKLRHKRSSAATAQRKQNYKDKRRNQRRELRRIRKWFGRVASPNPSYQQAQVHVDSPNLQININKSCRATIQKLHNWANTEDKGAGINRLLWEEEVNNRREQQPDPKAIYGEQKKE